MRGFRSDWIALSYVASREQILSNPNQFILPASLGRHMSGWQQKLLRLMINEEELLLKADVVALTLPGVAPTAE